MLLHKDHDQSIPLHWARSQRSGKIVEILLEQFAEDQVVSSNGNGCLPLHLMCAEGFVRSTKALMRYLPQTQVFWESAEGLPLHAARNGSTELVGILLEYHPEKQVVHRWLSLRPEDISASVFALLMKYEPEHQIMTGNRLPPFWEENVEWLDAVVQLFVQGSLLEEHLRHVAEGELLQRLCEEILRRRRLKSARKA